MNVKQLVICHVYFLLFTMAIRTMSVMILSAEEKHTKIYVLQKWMRKAEKLIDMDFVCQVVQSLVNGYDELQVVYTNKQ